MMLKPLIVITLLNLIPSCEGQQYQSPLDVPEIRLEVQANDYALKYTHDLLNGTTILVTKDKYAYEVFSIDDHVLGLINHYKFEKSPYEQLYETLTKEPNLVYELAKRTVEGNLTNYYFEDCPFLEDTAEYVLNTDLTDIKQAYTPPETPTITFMYPSKSYNYTDWHTLETDYAGHPLFDIYERLQKDIQKCEHPKFIGIPENLRARK
jgi:hypothetical protein